MPAEKIITDYMCITANTGSKNSEKGNDLLAENDGWQPLGTVAMVRYEGVVRRGAKT